MTPVTCIPILVATEARGGLDHDLLRRLGRRVSAALCRGKSRCAGAGGGRPRQRTKFKSFDRMDAVVARNGVRNFRADL